MPLVEVTHTAGAFAGVDRQSVTDSLTAAATDAERTDPRGGPARDGATFDAPEKFRCGADPAVAARTTVAEWLLDDDGRQALVEGATAALTVAVDGLEPMTPWVVVDEVPDGNWGAGGRIVPTSDIAALTGGGVVE